MTMPTRGPRWMAAMPSGNSPAPTIGAVFTPGILVVGTLVFIVGDDASATISADYPDSASATTAAADLAAASGVPVLDSYTYVLYALPLPPMLPRAGVATPPHPNVPPNHPSNRGVTDG